MGGNPNANPNQLIRTSWEGIQLVARTQVADIMTVRRGEKEEGRVSRERGMEMKILQSLAASSVNEIGRVSSGTRVQKVKKKKSIYTL